MIKTDVLKFFFKNSKIVQICPTCSNLFIVSNVIDHMFTEVVTDPDVELYSGAPSRGHVPISTSLITQTGNQKIQAQPKLKIDISSIDWNEWTSLLDQIRRTVVTKGEAGGITQAIGVSIIPIETIKKICGKLLDSLGDKLTVPGLLAIDTPGHAAFTSLRKRGGSLADIAILVVDINE